jgi:hypothetical protein
MERPQLPPAGEDHREYSWEELLQWLLKNKLTTAGNVYDEGPRAVLASAVFAAPLHRAEAATRDELKEIQDRWSSSALQDETKWNAIWSEIRNPDEALRRLDVARIPPDAIGFYRSFHVEPVDQWGIYVVLSNLLDYANSLGQSLRSIRAFEPSVLASLVLFDVFHHEFFHHLIECTATSFEILCPSNDGKPRPIYLDYCRDKWQQEMALHPHDPLEEALANAYSYNSFSFIARVKAGYLTGASRLYQKAVEKSWNKEPPGYCEAGFYITGQRLNGARLLLERMLQTVGRSTANLPIGMLVDAVFPRGHTAFWAKPDIPTYLVGSEQELRRFLSLVPAPNATYTSLFWPANTDRLDAFLKEQRQKERHARRQARGAREQQRQLFEPS